ncbi:MAG: glycosyltransferase [Chloroflexi bacterium]|nr:glycosyltransferase [Chloroflexota bacterium]
MNIRTFPAGSMPIFVNGIIDRAMHLAIVSPYPPNITGIGQYGYHTSRLLAQSGAFTRITVLTGGNGEQTGLQAAVSPVLDVKVSWQSESPFSGLAIAADLARIKPDIVWFNLGASVFGRSPLANISGFLMPIWASHQGFPTITTLHELVELADLRALKAPGGLLAPLGAHLLTSIALQADVICLTMQHYTDWISQKYKHKQPVHIPIGAYRQPELLPASVSPSRELLFFSTLAPFKGLEILLQAFQSLQAYYPDLRLTIAGAEHARFPGYASQLRQSYGQLQTIRWLGQVPETQVRALFENAQIICIPYTASTGSSSVIYQAAMWGRPVVASDLPEARAGAGEAGLDVAFFQNGSSVSLADKLRLLLDAPDLRRAQVDNNFKVIQNYRPEDICRSYLHAFNLALETHRSPKRLVIPTQLRLGSA